MRTTTSRISRCRARCAWMTPCAHSVLRNRCLSPAQLLNRQRGALFRHALVERAALSRRSWEFTVQLVDLAQSRAGGLGIQGFHSDLVASAAGISIFLKLHTAPQEQLDHTLFLRCCGLLESLSVTCTRPCRLCWTVKPWVKKWCSLNWPYLWF